MLPASLVYIIIIAVVGFIIIAIVQPALSKSAFREFYEEYAFPTLIVCALSVGLTTCMA